MRMKLKSLLVFLVAVIFIFAISCKERAKETAPEKAEVKAKAATIEKAEGKEAIAKEEKGEKEEAAEKEENEEKEEAAAKPATPDLKILPETVLSAFKTAYPNAVIKGTSKEVEKGETYYEIESVDGKTKRDLLYTADGKAAEIEEAITAADLPAAVQQTLAKEFPGYKVITAETLTKGDLKQFELQIQVGDKKLGVTIDPSGKITERTGEAKAEAPVKK
jgi:hypothetical protein